MRIKSKSMILAVVFAVLTGCIQRVNIPYPVCPKPKMLQLAPLLTDKARPKDPVEVILKAYVADIISLKGDRDALMKLLQGYVNIPSALP